MHCPYCSIEYSESQPCFCHSQLVPGTSETAREKLNESFAAAAMKMPVTGEVLTPNVQPTNERKLELA